VRRRGGVLDAGAWNVSDGLAWSSDLHFLRSFMSLHLYCVSTKKPPATERARAAPLGRGGGGGSSNNDEASFFAQGVAPIGYYDEPGSPGSN
jgi:hypothetical protein